MAARISALLLVTGLFVAAWSGDHAPVARMDVPPQPIKPAPYSDEPVRETALRRWKQRALVLPDATLEAIADASEAVRIAQAADDISVRIDWLGIGAQLREELNRGQQADQMKPLWHQLTASVAKLIDSERRVTRQPMAADTGTAVLK